MNDMCERMLTSGTSRLLLLTVPQPPTPYPPPTSNFLSNPIRDDDDAPSPAEYSRHNVVVDEVNLDYAHAAAPCRAHSSPCCTDPTSPQPRNLY